MLDRAETINRVRDIYREKVAPLIGFINEAYEDDDDEDFPPLKYYDEPEPAAEETPKKTKEQVEKELKEAFAELKPLLEKLGYLRPEHLSYELTDQQKNDLVLRRAKMAIGEEGNDPPDNEEVKEMESNPLSRSKHRGRLMEELSSLLLGAAKKQERKYSTRVRDAEGRSRETSAFDADDIVTTEVLRAIEQITKREVLKDGTVDPWDEDTNAFQMKIKDEDSASHLLNSLKSSTSHGSFKRDKDRDDYKAAATSPSSKNAPVSMDAPIAGSDGETTTMAVADVRSRDSLSNSVERESASVTMEAFKQAMLELKQQHPDWAVLVCLWLGLQDPPSLCAQKGGELGSQAIGRIRDAMMGVSLNSREARTLALKRMGQNNLIGRTGRGAGGIADWELIKAIKKNIPNPSGVMKDMPPGDPPPNWTPIYSQQHTFDEQQKKWWDYTGKVVHNLNTKALPFVWDRMSQIAAEKNEGEPPLGQESPCSWSLEKFLKKTFADQIRSGGAAIEGSSPSWKLVWRHADANARRKSGNIAIASFSMTLQEGGVRIARDGWENDHRFFKIPLFKCPKCRGVGEECPACEGCGSVMNRLETLKMEREIHAVLTSRRKRKSES
jgi:hypothetical protein